MPPLSPLESSSNKQSFFFFNHTEKEKTAVDEKTTELSKKTLKTRPLLDSEQPNKKRKLDNIYSLRREPNRLNRRTNIPPEWMEKRLNLSLNKITIHGQEYQLEEVGKGRFHKVFSFKKEEKVLTINEQELPLDSIVLKIVNSLVAPKKVQKTIEDDIKGYNFLKENEVPVATVFTDPTTFVDRQDPKNGKFWIVEKMTTISGESWKGEVSFGSLDLTDQKILNWAKGWFTVMAAEKEMIINDFRIRNTMLDSKGLPRIVDYSYDNDKDDFVLNLSYYILDWSKKNPLIIDYLTKDFDKEIKEDVLKQIQVLQESKAKNC